VERGSESGGDVDPAGPLVLILDNYDSFTWNLVQALEAEGARCVVRRSDSITLDEVEALAPARIVLSPGPFGPDRTGICPDVVRRFAATTPILGVCLGMQVIAAVAGARVAPSGMPVHGKTSEIHHEGAGVLRGLPSPFPGARYHSLQVVRESVPGGLEITARTPDGVIMGCRLRDTLAEGVLFHPESFLSSHSELLFRNFLADVV
jgi:anthranilate synthase component 2/para-aminobenzoate synthetase component 2